MLEKCILDYFLKFLSHVSTILCEATLQQSSFKARHFIYVDWSFIFSTYRSYIHFNFKYYESNTNKVHGQKFPKLKMSYCITPQLNVKQIVELYTYLGRAIDVIREKFMQVKVARFTLTWISFFVANWW